MHRVLKLFLYFSTAVAVITLSVGRTLLFRYLALEPDQQFALMWDHHNTTSQDLAFFARSRRSDYTDVDQFYFQWWNYIIYDGDTGEHINLAYQITDYPTNSVERDFGSVSIAIATGKHMTTGAVLEYPLSSVAVTNHADLAYTLPSDNSPSASTAPPSPAARVSQEASNASAAALSGPLHTHQFLDDDRVRVTGWYPADSTHDGKALAWDVTFTKVYGAYGSEDMEAAGDRTKCSIGGSCLYGFDSTISGWVYAGGRNRTYTASSPRFRGYGAGSWGCSLPRGEPAIEHPWAWLWIVVPGPTPAEDLAIEFGDARLNFGNGALYGATGIVGGAFGPGSLWDGRTAYALDKGPRGRGLRVQATSSDGGVSGLTVTQHDWKEFRDEHGSAMIPTRQVFSMETLEGRIVVDCTADISQYFRAAIKVYNPDLNTELVFSDFRAVGISAHIRIYRKLRSRAPASTLRRAATGLGAVTTAVTEELVREVRTEKFTAMEYAYRAEYNEVAGEKVTTAEALAARIGARVHTPSASVPDHAHSHIHATVPAEGSASASAAVERASGVSVRVGKDEL